MQYTGSLSIGTLQVQLKIAGTRQRVLKVRFWYPTDGPTTASGRWRSYCARLLSPLHGPAHRAARLLSGDRKLPLITYLPQTPGYRIDNTYTLANLASHGFVVAAICDPYSLTTEFAMQRSLDDAGGEPRSSRDGRVRSGVLAASALLDALAQPPNDSPLARWTERLDLKRVGIFGYAMGGTAAVTTIGVDGRYAVVATFDGSEDERPLVKVPYLHMRGSLGHNEVASGRVEAPKNAVDGNQRQRSQASLPTSHIIEVAGARPEHFTDWLISLLRAASPKDRPAFTRIRAIIDTYSVAFFKTYLEAMQHPLMCVRHSPYPEVRFIDDQTADMEFPMIDARPVQLAGAKSDAH